MCKPCALEANQSQIHYVKIVHPHKQASRLCFKLETSIFHRCVKLAVSCQLCNHTRSVYFYIIYDTGICMVKLFCNLQGLFWSFMQMLMRQPLVKILLWQVINYTCLRYLFPKSTWIVHSFPQNSNTKA